MNYGKIGPLIGLVCRHKGVSQQQFAEHIGVSRIAVNRFFCGHTDINSFKLTNALYALGIDIHKMLHDEIKPLSMLPGQELPVSKLNDIRKTV